MASVGWFCFFFSSRRRHTRSLCDWSSDVCSSDLTNLYFRAARLRHRARLARSRDGLPGGEQFRGVNPENMIWIFCTARSGSTWLRSMLNELVEGEVWEEPKVGRLFGEFYSRAKQT